MLSSYSPLDNVGLRQTNQRIKVEGIEKATTRHPCISHIYTVRVSVQCIDLSVLLYPASL